MRSGSRLGLALIAGVSVALDALLMTTPAVAARWECSAKNLKSYRYTGGSSAMIHLSPYPNGGTYPVTRVSATKVTGKTKDGTAFTCTLK
jgi:hypothetical protein